MTWRPAGSCCRSNSSSSTGVWFGSIVLAVSNASRAACTAGRACSSASGTDRSLTNATFRNSGPVGSWGEAGADVSHAASARVAATIAIADRLGLTDPVGVGTWIYGAQYLPGGCGGNNSHPRAISDIGWVGRLAPLDLRQVGG